MHCALAISLLNSDLSMSFNFRRDTSFVSYGGFGSRHVTARWSDIKASVVGGITGQSLSERVMIRSNVCPRTCVGILTCCARPKQSNISKKNVVHKCSIYLRCVD